jgi:Spy/CpxP family protein refolding chaperone
VVNATASRVVDAAAGRAAGRAASKATTHGSQHGGHRGGQRGGQQSSVTSAREHTRDPSLKVFNLCEKRPKPPLYILELQ